MNDAITDLIAELSCKNNIARKNALDALMELTEEKVDWIYDAWDILRGKLVSANSYQRSIGVLLLSNLAKSDYENRFLDAVDRYLALMEDEKFITSRQTIQNSWKVAVALEPMRDTLINYLLKMFSENKHLNSHANLIRKDIVGSLLNIQTVNKEAVDLGQIKFLIEMQCDERERNELEKILLNAINA